MKHLIDHELERNIVDYYAEAGIDYAYWSPALNMHFGFGNFSAILDREKMLNRMTSEIFKRLAIKEHHQHVADFGCGVGASMRWAASQFPNLKLTGLTIVPWQKQKCDALNHREDLHSRVHCFVEDFHHSSLTSHSFDGLYAIESTCYSPTALRNRLVSEMYRVLKRGARFVIADGFRKTDEYALPAWSRKIYNNICHNWALPGMMQIDHFVASLTKTGFKNVACENISWKVAPSMLHVPYVITRFLLTKTLTHQPLSAQSIKNLKGSFQTLLLGLQQQAFGYYLVTGER